MAGLAVVQDARRRCSTRRSCPPQWTTGNYTEILKTSQFIRPLINSIGIGLIATVIAVVLASMAAYAVARLRFPGKGVLIGMALLIAMFPQISLVTPLFNIERSLGLFNTWPGLIIPYVAFGLPLGIYTLSAFFREIPWELEKAAKMDGATPFQAFIKVIAPLAAPGMVTTAILVFLFCWNEFLFAISFTSTLAARTAPASHRLLQRQLAVHGADRPHRGRRGGHHHPDHHLRGVLPAPDRRRADIRRGQGLARIKERAVAEIVLDQVTKRYPDGALAVDKISLDIADGEFVILVGPSGCGKSTTLNMIAGLEDITEGELRIGGKVVNNKAPKDRDIAMVFQSYALYPHMTVRENMGFALKLAKTPQNVIDEKVNEAARILDLTQHLDRKPANLSGGQRQRVAMGRAIVRDPSAFLMDEPLSNLDAKLRVQMRTEVSRLQRRLGTTMVYVTHDQTEAMTLGRPGGGHAQRHAPAGGLAAGTLRAAGEPVRGGLHRLARDELHGRHAGGGQPAHRIRGHPALRQLRQAMAGSGAGRDVIVGIRPENFEDARAGLRDIRRRRDHVPGHHRCAGVPGLGEVRLLHPGAGQAWTRPSSTSWPGTPGGRTPARAGKPWSPGLTRPPASPRGRTPSSGLDARKLHVFDPATGQNLTLGNSGSPAGSAQPAGGDAPAQAEAGTSGQDTGSAATPPR